MLQNVIIMTFSGVVIFEKVWVDSDSAQSEKGRLFGSLITTMQEFSRQSTGGMVVSYVEFFEVAISIVDDYKSKLICTLFHDKDDGADFGQIIASSILRSFVDAYAAEISSFTGNLNVSIFSGFVSKLYEAIQSSLKTIIYQLQSSRGVQNALIVYDDGTAILTAQDDDQLGIVANLQPVITLSAELMQMMKDRPSTITLEMSQRQVVYIQRVGDASLVCICRKNVKSTIYQPAIDRSFELLQKVMALSKSLSVK